MPTIDSATAFPTQDVITEHYVDSCRCHLESMRNITYLLTIEGEHSKQENLQLKMMAWHLENLTTDFANTLR
jgi:hypothetical protein